jgi:hypothetical protein
MLPSPLCGINQRSIRENTMTKRFLLLTLLALPMTIESQSLNEILTGIEALEGARDPKCYATASRLEDFMYGTPLTDDARFQKNNLQKRLARLVWSRAGNGVDRVSPPEIDAAFAGIVSFRQDQDGSNFLKFPNREEIEINQTDVRHYGSVAYSLRAILAAQQDAMVDASQGPLKPISPEGLDFLKNRLDLTTLALLQEADAYARANDEYEITLQNINRSWLALFKYDETGAEKAPAPVVFSDTSPPLIAEIIRQKVASYAAYNQISNQLFVRNMQVYFARLSWPSDEAAAEAFRLGLIDALVGYGIELYRGVVEVAARNQSSVVREEHVARFVQHFTPYEVNEYEDVEFFPNSPEGKVQIEAYDLDAFRDSGVHWVYLGYALESPEVTQYLEVDPFAAELLAENIAQFGVLLLREAGMEGVRTGQERLSVELLAQAVQNIQQKVSATVAHQASGSAGKASIRSADSRSTPVADGPSTWFQDQTQSVGIDVVHRSSSWLNRLLRSYLQRDENTGIITIPPAFGGSGVAAGDVNNDGFPDILLLSGIGNKLYLNDGKGRFSDATESSGIEFVRPEDNRPGEPRQPLIADLDNDGWQDIVITYVDDNHRVYRNRGDGTFQDMTERAGLGGEGLVGGPATVFDYDNDGLLDLYVTYFGDYIHGVLPTLRRKNSNGLPNRLFRNRGDFNFEAVEAGVEDTGWGQAVAHTDFNLDNLQDLIVGNDFGTNVYYQNLGNGRFEDVSAAMGVDKPSYTMNIGLADLNADRIPDVYISNIVTMNKDEKYVLPNEDTQMKFNLEKLANLRVVEANDLFISARSASGGITYSLNRELVGRGYNSTGWSWGASFFDADLDGDDDLYVLNGMNEFNLYSSKNAYADPTVELSENTYLPVDTKETNVFFVNSDGRFGNVTARSGLDFQGNSRSAAYLDFDNDGDLDIIVNNYHERAHFFSNGAERLENHWIKLRLTGDPARGVNRDAIGAKVYLKLAEGDVIWREIHGSGGYMTVHDRTVHAGLGEMDRVDVEIVWPDGSKQVEKNLRSNRVHHIGMRNAPPAS